ncbi:MAG: VWA domain-containing protein [Acidobacteria bacterium]|nr:VWA domain-containing protein [Acidobacteriota bacterium]MCL5287945.1 VWA domain-containing protein [Acidobacteriota bacterium]
MKRYFAFMTFLLLFAAGASFAQAPPGPLPPKPGTKVQAAPPEKAQIKVRVNLVSAPVTVRDKSGEMVMDLEQKDFRVFDNGVEQRVEDYDLGGDPISLVIVAETSSRIEALLPAVRRTGILLTETVVGLTGEAAVVAFDDDVRLDLPFTADHTRIGKAMESLRMGTSGTRLYDALSQGVSLLKDRPLNRRRVILVVAEAADTGSDAPLGEILREAQVNNVVIYSATLSTTAAMLRAKPKQTGPYPIGPEGTFPVPGRNGRPQTPTTEQQDRTRLDLMNLLVWLVTRAANAVGDNSLDLAAMGTGGLNVPTFKDASIENAISTIGAELHAQYTLTYRPTGTDPAGYHEIKVNVARRGVSVRSRPGYYIAP